VLTTPVINGMTTKAAHTMLRMSKPWYTDIEYCQVTNISKCFATNPNDRYKNGDSRVDMCINFSNIKHTTNVRYCRSRLGRTKTLGGASGVTTGAGSTGQSGSNIGGVDRHLFCNTGVITPICK
jgi:hypothetical protein